MHTDLQSFVAALTESAAGMAHKVFLYGLLLSFLQNYGKRLQCKALRNDRHTRGACKGAALALNSRKNMYLAEFRKPRFGLARDRNELCSVIACGYGCCLKLCRLSAVGDADNYVICCKLTAGAVDSLRAV